MKYRHEIPNFNKNFLKLMINIMERPKAQKSLLFVPFTLYHTQDNNLFFPESALWFL